MQVASGTRLKLTIKGQSYLEPGDIIEFEYYAVERKQKEEMKLDPQYAGRYIISKIRHRVTNDIYIQVLECVKDSVFRPYHTDKEKYYQAKQLPYEKGPSDDIAGLDSIGTMDGY